MSTAIGAGRDLAAAQLARLLESYSVEVTARDATSFDRLAGRLPTGAEVFVANIPNDSLDLLVRAAARLRALGFVPVPHVVARNIRDLVELDSLMKRLAGEAGVDRVLSLGGDRDKPVGTLDASLQLIESGAYEKYGVRHVTLACYPEGHPRIGEQLLRSALDAKLAEAARRGLEVRLVSQFTFDPEPILAMTRRFRAAGISAPLRVGVAGPASRAKLIRYAMRCGVGASLRALTERKSLASSFLGGETPDELLSIVALAAAGDAALGIEGVHFFTFGAPESSVEWAQTTRAARPGA
jgi:methylenetetrahydrofolate reductase (NADPH)